MADESAMNFGGVGAFFSIFLLFTQYFYELGANFEEKGAPPSIATEQAASGR